MSEKLVYLTARMDYKDYLNQPSEEVDAFLKDEGFNLLHIVHEVYAFVEDEMVFLQEVVEVGE